MAEAQKEFVRLKPINAKQGHTNQTHIIRDKRFGSLKFEVKRGWYRLTQAQVDEGLPELLEEQLQDPTDPNSAFAFDVCTEKEARDLEAREIRARQRLIAATVDDAAAGVLTTSDTRGQGLKRDARAGIGRDEIRLRRQKEDEAQRRTEEAQIKKQTVTSGVDAARPLASLTTDAPPPTTAEDEGKPRGPPPMIDPNPNQEDLDDEPEDEGRLADIGRIETPPAAPTAPKAPEAPAPAPAKPEAPAPKAEGGTATAEAPRSRAPKAK